jgi:hypothetical protein
MPEGVRRGKWAWSALAGEAEDWTVRGAASSNKIQSLGAKECESPGFFPTLGVLRGGEPLTIPLFSPLPPPTIPTVVAVSLRSFALPLFPVYLFSFASQEGARSAV